MEQCITLNTGHGRKTEKDPRVEAEEVRLVQEDKNVGSFSEPTLWPLKGAALSRPRFVLVCRLVDTQARGGAKVSR